MVTPEVRLMVLYEVEKRIMAETTQISRKWDRGWRVLQDMIEEEFKHRDALMEQRCLKSS